MRTFVFIPPLGRHTGGLAVLLQVAAHLKDAGQDVWLAPREYKEGDLFPGPAADLPVLPWDSLDLTPDDVWLVPEGWVNALAPGLQAGARCLVYCQNWAYLLSGLPENVAWTQLPVSFLAVSDPVAWFLEQCTGLTAPVLRPGIDLERFAPAAKPEDVVRVAYMPRKNKALVQRVREIIAARTAAGRSPLGRGNAAVPLEWVEISGLPPSEVAARLASCHFFLASGFPEGFSLPPLEAMASGCFPVGFAGFGGWDYMRQTAPDLPFAAAPWWPREQAPDEPGGNGIWVADADVMAAALGLEQGMAWLFARALEFQRTLENARATARRYSLLRQKERCVELWSAMQADPS